MDSLSVIIWAYSFIKPISCRIDLFWSLFGEETKSKVRKTIDGEEGLKQAEKNFLQMGKMRNLLVHENFAEYDVNYTVEEIYTIYKSACDFISLIKTAFSPDFLKNS